MGQTLPQHIAIIMDGNGRWAKARLLPRSAGHIAGSRNFRTIAGHARDLGIGHITFYVFSTENWSRPKEEVEGLLKLFDQYLGEGLRDFRSENVRIRFLGDKSVFSQKLCDQMDALEADTANRTGMQMNLAVNYGGKAELVHACRRLAQRVAQGSLLPEGIDEAAIEGELFTAGQPPVDLIIRTGGDQRISNFLLWQSAYAELAVVQKYWPEFTPADFDAVLADFAGRERRFGNAQL